MTPTRHAHAVLVCPGRHREVLAGPAGSDPVAGNPPNTGVEHLLAHKESPTHQPRPHGSGIVPSTASTQSGADSCAAAIDSQPRPRIRAIALPAVHPLIRSQPSSASSSQAIVAAVGGTTVEQLNDDGLHVRANAALDHEHGQFAVLVERDALGPGRLTGPVHSFMTANRSIVRGGGPRW